MDKIFFKKLPGEAGNVPLVFSITTIHVQILFQNLVEPKSFHKKILNDITNVEILEVIENFGEYFDPNDYEMLHFFIEFNRNEKLNDNF